MARPSEAWLCLPRRNANRESRVYDCQNWRGDVVALLGASAGDFGVIRERVTYSSYGVPQGLPPGDLDNDADADAADETLWNTLSGGPYDVRADLDLDLDGDMDIGDEGLITGAVNQGFAMGRGVLTRDNGIDYAVGNRKGYAGYEHDGVFHTMCHVRNRVLMTELGRWSRRDPLGYVDGMGLYEYVRSSPHDSTDTLGLIEDPGFDVPGPVYMPRAPDRVPSQAPVGPDLPGGGGTCDNNPSGIDISACSHEGYTNPQGSNSTICGSYPFTYRYRGAHAACFCGCMGDSSWSNHVRSCLWCMYNRSICADTAHNNCYASASVMYTDPGLTLFAACYTYCAIVW